MTPKQEARALAAMLAPPTGRSGARTNPPRKRKQRTVLWLEPEANRRLARAARDAGVSRAELVRRHLRPVLERCTGDS
jgi:hypothetical protein